MIFSKINVAACIFFLLLLFWRGKIGPEEIHKGGKAPAKLVSFINIMDK